MKWKRFVHPKLLKMVLTVVTGLANYTQEKSTLLTIVVL
jgi:hypothetical protein